MRTFFSCVLSLAVLVTSLATPAVFAQENIRAKSVALVALFQGEEIQLPEDFVARLDGDQLKLALKSFGLAEKNLDRDLLVSLIQEDGTKTELRPDANGELIFNNVSEGLAAIVVASGQAAYAALAIYAVPGIERAAAGFEIPVGKVDPAGLGAAVESAGTAPKGAAATSLADYKPAAVNRFRVYLQASGKLVGHVVVPEEGFANKLGSVNVAFFKQGELVGNAVTADDGYFGVEGLQPGVHSVFANGPAGHAAFAFEVVAPKPEELQVTQVDAANKTHLVSFQPAAAEPASELIVLLIPPRLMPGVRDAVRQSYPAAADAGVASVNPLSAGGMAAGGGGGGFGGGGSFGGGGGGGLGGGGGIGGLLGIAGLAVGVAALSNQDNGFDVNLATQISP